MGQIAKQVANEVGHRETKFYKFKGEVPVDLLKFIDQINTALDLPPLEEPQVMLMAKFVMYEFATMTMAEMEDAIFKAKAGKLNCNAADYNKLSIDFLGRILGAYKEFKEKNNLIVLANELEATNRLEYTPDLGKKSVEFIESVYEKDGKEPYIANWTSAFKHLEETGVIVLSNDEKAMFLDNVRYEIMEEIELSKKARKVVTGLQNTLSDPKLMKYECHKRLVKKHFEGKIK
jgi:hypothetical protein